MASIDEVAAALRGMGYSHDQALALASDPEGEPQRCAERRLRHFTHPTCFAAPRVEPGPGQPRKRREARYTPAFLARLSGPLGHGELGRIAAESGIAYSTIVNLRSHLRAKRPARKIAP